MNRRTFSKMAIGGLSGTVGLTLSSGPLTTAQAQTARPNRSFINGVQFGLQPFCYHDLPMNIANRPELIRRTVQNGFGMIELWTTYCEPRFDSPGVTPEAARQKLREWRTSTPLSYYENIKKEFDNAGISIFSYWTNINETFTEPEIDATYAAAKALGCKGLTGSHGLAMSAKLAKYPKKYGLFGGMHNHDNLSDPDAFSNEASFEKGFAISPDLMATLDVRHFTAGDGDSVGFLQRHHARVSSVHLGDRRRHNGHSAPFGEGDAPIIEVLRTIRDNQWPIAVLLEFEHGTLRPGVEEVQLMFDYCKRALA